MPNNAEYWNGKLERRGLLYKDGMDPAALCTLDEVDLLCLGCELLAPEPRKCLHTYHLRFGNLTPWSYRKAR